MNNVIRNSTQTVAQAQDLCCWHHYSWPHQNIQFWSKSNFSIVFRIQLQHQKVFPDHLAYIPNNLFGRSVCICSCLTKLVDFNYCIFSYYSYPSVCVSRSFCLTQIDNKGNRLLVHDESSINVPAVAAAHVIKRYIAQAADELSFEVIL